MEIPDAEALPMIRGRRGFLMEMKEATTSESIKVELDFVAKIARQAKEEGKIPCLVLGFPKAVLPTPERWIALPSSFLSSLLSMKTETSSSGMTEPTTRKRKTKRS